MILKWLLVFVGITCLIAGQRFDSDVLTVAGGACVGSAVMLP